MEAIRIGVISDTHGMLRSEAVEALQGSQLILHAGDVGRPEILDALRAIAPVVAVRGNVDTAPWAQALKETELVTVAGITLLVLHDIGQLAAATSSLPEYHAVISGHSHKPFQQMRDGVLFLNPGSAGPRRFRLPVSVARMTVQNRRIDAELVSLSV
jgi:uncharacterized protein